MTQDEAGIVTKLSPHPVADTVSKLTGMISAKGIKLFAVIDQSAEARQAGLSLRDTTLVIFGSPAAGTPVMAAAPLCLDHPGADGEQAGVGQHFDHPRLAVDPLELCQQHRAASGRSLVCVGESQQHRAGDVIGDIAPANHDDPLAQ